MMWMEGVVSGFCHVVLVFLVNITKSCIRFIVVDTWLTIYGVCLHQFLFFSSRFYEKIS